MRVSLFNMNLYNQLPTQATLQKTVTALEQNGITVHVVENSQEAKEKVLSVIPQQAEVMTMTSITLEETGIAEALNDTTTYNPSRDKLYALDRQTQAKEMNVLGATSTYTVGSVHAVTESGNVVVASATGSQLPAYAYSSPNVIWVVGAQKIVPTIDDALKRIEEYVLPLESERAKKAYGVPGSVIAKLLIFNKEVTPGRITMILVKEVLGY